MIYSGNMGLKQGLEIMVEAAALVRDARAQIVLCGQGAAREQLARKLAREPVPNLRILDLQDDEAYREMMVEADLCLITQQKGTGQFFSRANC